MKLSEKLAEKAYVAEDDGERRSSFFAKTVARYGVQRTSEFLRVQKLPRRDWVQGVTRELVDLCTNALKTPGGTMTLWPQQVAALKDIVEVNGLFGPLAVGAGKALLTLTAPVVLEAKRPILLLPASLRDQTLLKVIPEMRLHWRLHPNLLVVGYEELSLEKNKELLEKLNPDLIIADEAHFLRNPSSGRSRRVGRYMKANPATRFVALSGTITKRSLRDYHHLLAWSLKSDMMPLPSSWRELQDWADAIDERPAQRDEQAERVVAPGALSDFCAVGEDVRHGYRRRLTETPGVIASGEQELGVSLEIRKRLLEAPHAVLEAIHALERTWCTPNGDELTDALSLWRHERELCLGFWLRWKDPAPAEWLSARGEWNRYVRDRLQTNRSGLDTPLQVWKEAAEMERPLECWVKWRKVKDSFKPVSVPEWLSDFAVRDCAAWLKEFEGIVWTSHPCFGEAVAKKSGRPYFGAGDQASRDILDATGGIVASVQAQGVGKNLQAWSQCLITSSPTTGSRFEQVLGRCHRPGQQADTVVVDVYLWSEAQKASFERARADAKYIQDTLGAQQKLCYASVLA